MTTNEDDAVRKAASAMGKKGGPIGGKAEVPKGFSMMDPKRRRALAILAANKRWGKKATAKAKPK